MIGLYEAIMEAGSPVLRSLLENRRKKGKEDAARLPERMGQASRPRPSGPLVWVHAASVGEAQSALILIDALLLRHPSLHILVTTGTLSSAQLLGRRLPFQAFHQFFPLDRPAWARAFLDHWSPDMVFWMESELWPAMLRETGRRKIPAILVNARLSPRSFRRWRMVKAVAKNILSTFSLVLTQNTQDEEYFRSLGAPQAITTSNLKYSAAPLPCDADVLAGLQNSVEGRPLWLYASTHDGEEELAFRLHARLAAIFPRLLTVIVPRHPERREDIMRNAAASGLPVKLRSAHPSIEAHDRIYIADTLGELGLFYRLCPVACIGRSFSSDGGGGHNPIEAAQLGCAVLHGPRVQNLEEIYSEMDAAHACIRLADEAAFLHHLEKLLGSPVELAALQQAGLRFIAGKSRIIDTVMKHIEPILPVLSPQDCRECA